MFVIVDFFFVICCVVGIFLFGFYSVCGFIWWWWIFIGILEWIFIICCIILVLVCVVFLNDCIVLFSVIGSSCGLLLIFFDSGWCILIRCVLFGLVEIFIGVLMIFILVFGVIWLKSVLILLFCRWI